MNNGINPCDYFDFGPILSFEIIREKILTTKEHCSTMFHPNLFSTSKTHIVEIMGPRYFHPNLFSTSKTHIVEIMGISKLFQSYPFYLQCWHYVTQVQDMYMCITICSVFCIQAPPCYDKDALCPDFARDGMCMLEPAYMTQFCQKSCDFCIRRKCYFPCSRSVPFQKSNSL